MKKFICLLFLVSVLFCNNLTGEETRLPEDIYNPYAGEKAFGDAFIKSFEKAQDRAWEKQIRQELQNQTKYNWESTPKVDLDAWHKKQMKAMETYMDQSRSVLIINLGEPQSIIDNGEEGEIYIYKSYGHWFINSYIFFLSKDGTIYYGVVKTSFSNRSFTKDVSVSGYYRKDEIYVRPHHRSSPDGVKWNNYGRPSSKQHRYDYDDEAIKKAKDAIQINPNLAETHYKLGEIYFEKGLCELAIEEYKKAIKINPNFANAHYDISLVYWTIGKQKDALEECKILKELDKEKANELFNLIHK
ncbi:tetratricopeptide repeat protein [bacterium]|nr:tetratricopeptide repeat protein [bacterium]